MKIAFVGMSRHPSTIRDGYLYNFVRYHLELPFYFQKFCPADVTLTFPVLPDDRLEDRRDCERLDLTSERDFIDAYGDDEFDVIVHWRKWADHLYKSGSVNVLLSQDHSFGPEWLATVKRAFAERRLSNILVFPGWHKENTFRELDGAIPRESLVSGLTLGVDTDIYYPASPDPHQLLWAADPGRGMDRLIPMFLKLQSMDSRFRLVVTWPDYVTDVSRYDWFFSRPGVNTLAQIPNDSKLWETFRASGVLPYPSTFPEPSSRCHRQAMACGSLVLYPPNMGTPSEQIVLANGGIVENVDLWPRLICESVASGRWQELGQNAAAYAASESWAVQAKRFSDRFRRTDG